ncbi:MAG: hypothetical protein ACTHOP_22180 [Mesorhizobium sp.]
MSDLIERATKAIDLFDSICNIHDPSVSAHDRRVRAMEKVLEAALLSPSPAPGVVEALKQLVYEATHLSPRDDDGSHLCRISASALVNARAALASLSQPAKGEREGGGA